jgi:hypothetical protein
MVTLFLYFKYSIFTFLSNIVFASSVPLIASKKRVSSGTFLKNKGAKKGVLQGIMKKT